MASCNLIIKQADRVFICKWIPGPDINYNKKLTIFVSSVGNSHHSDRRVTDSLRKEALLRLCACMCMCVRVMSC